MLKDKLEVLKNIIEGSGRMTVALSGGVDSTFLLVFAYSIWGDDRVSAVSAAGPHFAEDEGSYAGEVCRRLGISHKRIDMSVLLDVIEDNPVDRCYFCKKALLTALKEYAESLGSILADGTNLDDMSDYRPGYRAVQELGVSSPLKEAGLTKEDIRQALHDLAEENAAIGEAMSMEDGMTIWQKPAFACLASRIPYGERVTLEKLRMIYSCEKTLRDRGYTQLRVRCHQVAKGAGSGLMARVELIPEELERALDPGEAAAIRDAIYGAGFDFAALDLGGYRMGNMN